MAVGVSARATNRGPLGWTLATFERVVAVLASHTSSGTSVTGSGEAHGPFRGAWARVFIPSPCPEKPLRVVIASRQEVPRCASCRGAPTLAVLVEHVLKEADASNVFPNTVKYRLQCANPA